MAHKQSFGLRLSILLIAGVGVSHAASVSPSVPQSRLAGDWSSTQAVSLPAATLPARFTAADLGAAQPSLRLERILLLLQPSAAQRQALTAELESQRNPSSSEYHRWLTPSAFAAAFSNSASDLAAVSAWLQSQGFQVAPLPAGRGWIEFSGTVSQVEQAFQAQVHTFDTASGPRPALLGPISVPGALAPLVQGLVSLDGSLAAPALTAAQPIHDSVSSLAAQTALNKAEALTPQLMAQLLHTGEQAADGSGETIAIPSRSNVLGSDIAAFRATFSLPPSPLAVLVNGPDPGLAADQAEATLAASWAGAVAPGAHVALVPAASTAATDGLDISLASIVDQALAHTVAIGYSSCEASLSPAHQAFYAALYRQAAAEGIALVVASGDSGSAACQAAGSLAPVASGYGVNALASTPWNIAAGVAAFGLSGPAADASTLAAWSPLNAADPSYAGGGGASALYAAPSWQIGQTASSPSGAAALATGTALPSARRLLPDVSLPAALDSGVNRGLAFCLSNASGASGCKLMRAGGSSAAASLFAGIASLVAQQYGAQGNLAPSLYALGNVNGVFSDVQQGSTELPCAAGTPDCGTSRKIGFAASPGYDLATGLGVVNVKALLTHFPRPEATGSGLVSITNTTTTGQTINPSGSVVLSANVISQTGGNAPTGTVSFFDQTVNSTIATVALVPGLGQVSTASVTVTGVLAKGGHPILAQYSGDATYASAQDPIPVVVQVQPSPTATVVTPANSFPAPGDSLTVTAVVTSSNAGSGANAPSGTVDFRLDGVSQGTKPVVPGVPAAPSTNSTSSISITVPYVSGAHQLVGFYSGDSNYTSSTSVAAGISVSSVTPTVVLTPATGTPLAGSSLQLTANITPPGTGGTAPTGTVTFTLDGATVGTALVSPGSPSSTAITTITAPAVGTHTLVATYSGDSNYTTAASNSVSINVAKTPTTVTLTPATTTPASGGSLLLTATVTPSTSSSGIPTGTVTFTLDGVTQAIANVVGGTTATTTITVPASGSHNVQAAYSGDTNFTAASSSAVSLTVAKTPTTTVVSPATTTPTAGGTLQVTATINPTASISAQPGGTVTFTLDGVTQGVSPVTSGSPSTASITVTVPTAGSHTLAASYSGDSNFGASTSTGSVITVGKSAPTVTVTPSSYSPTAGGSLQISASIAPSASGAVAPTGTVSFTVDGSPVGTGAVVGGSPSTATVTLTAPSVGTHTLQATYSGDGNYTTALSPGVSITVGKSPTTLTVTPATATPLGGSSMLVTATLNATVSGSTTPTGTVTFTLDGATVGSGSVVNGNTATATISVPATGSHTLQASYSGDANYNSSVSPSTAITVAKSATSTVVTPATTTPALGASVPVTATISSTNPGSTLPTGTVTFTVDGGATTIVQSVLPGSPSTASATLPALSPGAHTVQATYSGDSYYSASTATAATLTVPKSTTTTTVTPAQNSIIGGSSLQVTSSTIPTTVGPTLPTGTVTYTLDGASVGIAAVNAGSPATSTLTIPSVAPGTHLLQAAYSGDTYYGASTASAVTITASKGSTVTVLTPSTQTPTAGGSMLVTVSVTSPNPGGTAPSGTVNITLDGVSVGVGTVVPGVPSTAAVTLPIVGAGSHLLVATYSGDTNYTGSSSTAVPIVAAKGATVTSVVATPPALAAGVNETLTATIAPVNPVTGTVYTITGTVSFYDGGTTLLGKVSVAGNTAIITGVKLADNISHIITAVYSGDTNWTASTSGPLPLDATTLPDFIVLTANSTNPQPGQAIVLTLTVTPTAAPATTGEQNPTGTVIFYNGTTVLGMAALVPDALDDASIATLTTQTLPGGMDTVYAYYQGDLYYDAGDSNLLNLNVQDFTITPSPSNPATNLTIAKGSAGSASFIITGLGGFNNQIQVVCAVPTQDDMSCIASPQQIVPTGTVTFTVQTYKTGGPSSTASLHSRPLWPGAAGGAALAFLGFFCLPYGRRARIFTGRNTRRFFILLLLLVGIGGASIGCTNTALITSNSTGTPLGVATLKITANAYVDNTVVSHSVYLTVNVTAAP